MRGMTPLRFLLLGLFAVVLTACGSGDVETPADEPVPTTAAPVSAATATQSPAPTATPRPEPTPTPDAVNGEKVFLNNQCSVCHSTGTNRVTGPGLEGLFARAESRGTGQTAEEYVRTSIIDPGAFVVDGFPNAMPEGFGFFIPESDIQDLIAYLKTLN